MTKMEQKDKNFRHIVRIRGTDLPGNKPLLYSLRKVKGINFILSNAICATTNLDKHKLAGNLTDDEIKRLNTALETIDLPKWIINRRKDPTTGRDKHLFGADIMLAQDSDIKIQRKIKSYKGFRHGKGLPVRGQRTKSNFRRNKGKSLGVQRKRQGK